MTRKIGFVSEILLLGGLGLLSAFAQTAPQYGPADAGPGIADDQGVLPNQIDLEDRNHGVARVSLLNGDVSIRRGDSGDFVAAAINAPLLALDSVQTGPGSRAELQFDTANRVRFGNDTEARLSQLTGDHFQLQIARGLVTWTVLGESASQVEIATPSVAIHPLGQGAYRIAILGDGTTQITVRAGTVEVYTPRGLERVEAGQTMMARGPLENPEFQVNSAIGQDEWDQFNERRDRELLSSQSYNYVSRDIAGAEDLDNYGQWNSDPTYGQVWTPRVASDWAPYRLGRWTNEDYYGWTWVSADPWGWAPYHYGSWFQGSYGWSWCPGPRYSHHYYRPALVAFFGYGHGGGVNFGSGWGFGNVGWVPLAPYERFHPWYGRGGLARGGNIVSNTNVTNIYRNARSVNGVTSINSRDFAGGHFGRYSSPGVNQLQQAGVVRGQMPFSPTSNHNRFNDRQTNVQPRTNFNQTRFADHLPSSNFNRQGTTPAQQNGAGFGRQSGNRFPQSVPQNPGGSSNWNRFGSPNGAAFPSRSPQVQNYQSNGAGSNWQRFGDPGAARQSYTAAPPSNGFGNYRQFDRAQPQQFGRGNSQSVQVAPPVVRERSGSGFYGRPSQQPSYSQPSYNQQRYNPPAQSRQTFNQQPRQESRPSYQQRQDSGRQGSAGGGNSNREGGRNRR